jgi:hypothetical protein
MSNSAFPKEGHFNGEDDWTPWMRRPVGALTGRDL